MTFVAGSCFPYDGGHTPTFAECVVRPAEIDPDNERVLANGNDEYLAPAEQD